MKDGVPSSNTPLERGKTAFPPSNEPSEGGKAAFPPLARRWKLISFKWKLRRLVRALVSLVGSFRAAVECQNGAARAWPAPPGSGRSADHRQLLDWLAHRPPDEIFRTVLEAIRIGISVLPPDESEQRGHGHRRDPPPSGKVRKGASVPWVPIGAVEEGGTCLGEEGGTCLATTPRAASLGANRAFSPPARGRTEPAG